MKMNILLAGLFILIFSPVAFSFEQILSSDQCEYSIPYANFAGHGIADFAVGAMRISKRSFKKREPANLVKLVAIESDFKVPPVLGDNWWGNIYIDPATNTLRYRDETIADANYRKESADQPLYRMSNAVFQANNVNRGPGLVLLNEHGAYVSVKAVGTAFNTRSGGPVVFNFKSPGGSPTIVKMNIAIRNGRVTNSVVTPAGPVVFDSLKIRTGFSGIIGGVNKIEFRKNGILVFTLDT